MGVAPESGFSAGGSSSGRLSILPFTLTTPPRHALHDDARDWPATNCYADLWIEMLHALDCDPLAALSCTLAIDFEADQWTFFKPPAADLQLLYGIDVQELTVWRPVIDHIESHLSLGRPLIVEVDSWHLPDTAGVSYHVQHDKTSIAVHTLHRDSRTVGYFHNSGCYTLTGDDFDGIFASNQPGGVALVPYVELVKLDRLVRRDQSSLTEISATLARAQLARRPSTNPVARYGALVARDATWLTEQGIDTFHLYAFATLRQLGAGCATAASYIRWLEKNGGVRSDGNAISAAADLDAISVGAKSLQFALARAVSRKKPSDVATLLGDMAGRWDSAMISLDRALAI